MRFRDSLVPWRHGSVLTTRGSIAAGSGSDRAGCPAARYRRRPGTLLASIRPAPPFKRLRRRSPDGSYMRSGGDADLAGIAERRPEQFLRHTLFTRQTSAGRLWRRAGAAPAPASRAWRRLAEALAITLRPVWRGSRWKLMIAVDAGMRGHPRPWQRRRPRRRLSTPGGSTSRQKSADLQRGHGVKGEGLSTAAIAGEQRRAVSSEAGQAGSGKFQGRSVAPATRGGTWRGDRGGRDLARPR